MACENCPFLHHQWSTVMKNFVVQYASMMILPKCQDHKIPSDYHVDTSLLGFSQLQNWEQDHPLAYEIHDDPTSSGVVMVLAAGQPHSVVMDLWRWS